jgi:hypothetical protein
MEAVVSCGGAREGTQFTCFTGTKIQIPTHFFSFAKNERLWCSKTSSAPWSSCFTYFTGTKVQVMTLFFSCEERAPIVLENILCSLELVWGTAGTVCSGSLLLQQQPLSSGVFVHVYANIYIYQYTYTHTQQSPACSRRSCTPSSQHTARLDIYIYLRIHTLSLSLSHTHIHTAESCLQPSLMHTILAAHSGQMRQDEERCRYTCFTNVLACFTSTCLVVQKYWLRGTKVLP